MQNSLDSICSASRKNCSRCAADFFDFTPTGRSNICLHCRKPIVRKHRQELNVLGSALTLRQRQITEMISRGKPNKEIAYELALTVGTIKVFVSSIFLRTGCQNRTQLALWWLKSDNPSQSA